MYKSCEILRALCLTPWTYSLPRRPLRCVGDSAVTFQVEPQSLRLMLEGAGIKTLEWQNVTAPSVEWPQTPVANMSNRPTVWPPPQGLNLLKGAILGTQ